MAWMGQNNTMISPHLKQMASNFKSITTNKASSMGAAMARVPGSLLMSRYGVAAGLNVVGAVMTYDPTQHTIAGHFGKEAISMAAGEATWGLTGGLGSMTASGLGLGAIASGGIMIAGAAASMAAYSVAGSLVDKAAERYGEMSRGGVTPIKQNERTMKAMQKSLNLLGQSGRRHSMLGNEAQSMHN